MAETLEPQNKGIIHPQEITREMQEAYLDYAMSVIVARALPDVRDGLKPVHRRILYAMWSLGLKAGAKHRKSATVVGEVLGKYHPHGDSAVYDTLVRMAQNFSMRYPLVNGQGNFGSMDGDSAAAMRYTESKLHKISEELLGDLEKETVGFRPNYDSTQQEPEVLPARIPNLLLNGSVGIAVGMATNIPPHNLTEIVNASLHLLEHEDATVEDLMAYVKGPDFPTGGIIFDKREIHEAYATGKGKIVMRAKTDIEETKAGVFRILVTEMPYQVNKASLVEKIALLVREKKIDGIKDLRDESNKDGVRIVIELKKESYPKKVLNQLFKLTQLQEAFHVNMLALVDGLQPRILTLRSALESYLKHRREVIVRRTRFDLHKAQDRAHILEGLTLALEHIDKIIATIKKSKDRDTAKENLIKAFKLSERQALAILEMRLQQLANLERLRVEEELKEKRALIKELESILASPKKVNALIKKDLEEVRDAYGDERRTKIVAGAVDSFSAEDLIPNEPTMVMITRDNYIKRLPPETFKAQIRGGKGVVGLTTKEEDTVAHFFTTTTHSDILFFTTKGKVFQLKAYELPQGSRTAKGQALVNFLQLAQGEHVSAVLPLAELEDAKFLIMLTHNGVIKKTALEDFSNVRRSGLIALTLKGGDTLGWVQPSRGTDEVLLATSNGQAIRFSEKQLRSMGRTAAGVRAITLRGSDAVVGFDVIDALIKKHKESAFMVVSKEGFGKRTSLHEYKVQGRGGRGIKTLQKTAKTGEVIFASAIVGVEHDLILISQKGQVIRMNAKAVSLLGRATQGVRLMRFKEKGDTVASVAFV